jgi:phosphoribosylformimino-5-aminoimidazole carboxamide ribotide isomerase
MQLIPAIDLRGGRVVRLTRGDDRQRTTYDRTPEEVIDHYLEAGVTLVHVIDLDAAFGEAPQSQLIATLARRAPIELGGGLRDEAAVERALGELGCRRVILGSMVARDFDRFARIAEAHPGGVVPALEVADRRLKVAGWTEDADLSPEELAHRLRGLPCPALLVTDVERDGTLQGPNLPLTVRLAKLSGLGALVSGGVQSPVDLEAARALPGIAGAIVGKALYEGRFTLEEALAACAGETS